MVIGLITEYNPFHNGHLYHLENSKEKTKAKNVIVVMSGNFVQRGEPAFLSKHLRAKMALLNGADIVLELPTIFSTGGADLFALGSVDLLNKTNLVDAVCFGSEKGSLDEFKNIAEILANETTDFKNIFKAELKKGASFPLARSKALETFLDKDLGFLKTPNNVLSLEYLIALKKTNSKIAAETIKRTGAGFHSKELIGEIASATAIRAFAASSDTLAIKNCMPENCFEILKPYLSNFKTIDSYSQVLNYILRNKKPSELSLIADVTEGLENRMLKTLPMDNFLITDFIKLVKTKRYTYAKIQKAIMHIILNITKEEQKILVENGLNRYIKVLGFRKESSNLVSKLCENSLVPVITNAAKDCKKLNETALNLLHKEVKYTDIFHFNSSFPLGQEFREPIVVI